LADVDHAFVREQPALDRRPEAPARHAGDRLGERLAELPLRHEGSPDPLGQAQLADDLGLGEVGGGQGYSSIVS
jgi:hypothetical protein